MAEIVKDTVFYDESRGGVTFSGGEPLMQPEFLETLLNQCRQQAIHTAVDTCCHTSGAVMKQIASLADLFLCDIKHMNSDKHKQFTGIENSQILENISFLADLNRPMIIRIPVVPGFNDTPEEIHAIVQFVKTLKTIQQIDLLPYNSGGVSKAQRLGRSDEILQQRPPDETVMQAFASGIRQEGFKVNIGG
jgi:pyruvate formate lyase activating enzyme